MVHIWDYDINILKKSNDSRRIILERMINYGPDGEKIKLSEVKKYWDKLDLFPSQKRLLELLIWGKYTSSPKTKTYSRRCRQRQLLHKALLYGS